MMEAEKALPEQRLPDAQWRQLLREQGLLEKVQATFPVANALPTDNRTSKAANIVNALTLLTESGQVVELRILGIHGKKRTDSGYFSDLNKLATLALSYDGRAEGIYFTLNPIRPDLIARANNRIKEYAPHTTADADIVKRITLPIDFDPVRPAGISSNAMEKQAALERAWACHIWLTAQGWPEPVFADSGNGAHLLYAIDLPNDEVSTKLVKDCLTSLGSLFSDDQVKVDCSTSNASRIFKLYGTLACKGDPRSERPHRRAAILSAPETRRLVSRELLAVLASTGPAPTTPVSTRPQLTIVHRGQGQTERRYAQSALSQELAQLASAQPGNRNNQLFKSAAALYSLVAAGVLNAGGVDQGLLSTALTLGLSEQEARRTIQSGRESGMNNPRNLSGTMSKKSKPTLDIPLDKPLGKALDQLDIRQAQPVTKQQPVNRLMHVDDLDTLPPIRWLIQDYLPEDSLVEVYGAPSAGKTQVVFDMAQTLAASGKTVIYVVAEGLRGYRSRKKAWQKFRKQLGGELYIWPEPVQLFERQAVREFIATVQLKKPALVVFDTLSRCSLGADENNQKDMGFILDSLDCVRRETGATVIAVHHTNANGIRERGSTVVRGGMDVMMEVSKEDDLIAVSCAKVKDSAEFNTLYLKPVLVDIDEEQPVPVLIPASRQLQTTADKLSSLQLEILRAVGMEMFKVSGIKSSQLDELLPPNTKRASKYYSLNSLIRLGYVAPHEKGDPYLITDAGRLKLSNAENALTTAMSNSSKPSLSPFIWTLPDACPMSSPIPHTYGCGMDETLDNKGTTQTNNTSAQPKMLEFQKKQLPDVQSVEPGHEIASTDSLDLNVQIPDEHDQTLDIPASSAPAPVEYPAMTDLDIARYADQAGVKLPIDSAVKLYQVAELVPRRLRNAFELAFEEKLLSGYYNEIAKRGEPTERPISDIVALYIDLAIIPAPNLLTGYQRACTFGHGRQFWEALTIRNDKAIACLKAMLNGRKLSTMVHIPRLANQG